MRSRIFDLKTKKGRKVVLPSVGFANDPAVMENAVYISDNGNDKLVKVEPADFLDAKNPKVTEVLARMKPQSERRVLYGKPTTATSFG